MLMDERRDYRFVWIFLFALLLLTRLPAVTTYFGIDNVNLALSLEKFDPRVHQPQPPGYPFFVGFARLVNFFFDDARQTFLAVSLLTTGLSLVAAYALGARMFSRWAGAAAAFLLVVNPVFWHASVDPNGGPVRPFLALFSLLTGYCCWRCWNGEKSFAIWGAIALGVGSGFRPDLLAFLLPAWFISTCVGTRSWRTVLAGCAVLSGIAVVWTAALLLSMRGGSLAEDFQIFRKLMLDYAVDQSRPESVVLGSSVMAWLKQVNRLVIWNGLAVITWIWAVPLCLREIRKVAGSHGAFFFIWLVPGLIVQALVHVGAPGHTVFSVVALCILGGYVLSVVRSRDLALTSALAFNAMLFLNLFAVPADASNAADRTPSIRNAVLFGTFETSLISVRSMDEITRVTLQEIEQFRPKDRPFVIITTDRHKEQWFMNWLIGRYYLPNDEMWVLYHDIPRKRFERIRRDARLEMRNVAPYRIPIFREGRILWLIEPHSDIHRQIASTQQLNGGRYVFYSDITPESPAFMVDQFEIVPTLFGFMPPQINQP